MNKKFLKALALVGCALLLVTASVVGTYAVLTSTATITNTFTAGNVSITLKESSVIDSYKLIPGKTYTKDPVITVVDGSESCWLFVKVVNGIAGAEIAPDDTAAEGETETIAEQMAANGWKLLTGSSNVYYKENTVAAKATVTVFESFTIKADAAVETFKDATITVTAYAVQAEGFGTAEAAWGATFGTTPNP